MLMAGYASAVRHTILIDYLRVAQKLEQLGFTFYNGKVTVVELEVGQKVYS
jgi:hypothetical protein